MVFMGYSSVPRVKVFIYLVRRYNIFVNYSCLVFTVAISTGWILHLRVFVLLMGCTLQGLKRQLQQTGEDEDLEYVEEVSI